MKRNRPFKQLVDDKEDLGFGSRISQQTQERLLNKDGSFNVAREGISVIRSNSVYHFLLTVSWTWFYTIISATYLFVNACFAVLLLISGSDAITGDNGTTLLEHFWNEFFFSVQTFATIGYGTLAPQSFYANVIVVAESLFGILYVAIATGLLFARFSRPNAKVLFSRNAVITPFREGTAFMFRMINLRSSQLLNVTAEVIYSRMEEDQGKRIRRYHKLSLERETVLFFPLHWTVVHVIDQKSPLHNVTQKEMERDETEFMILVHAVDETYSQTVYTRSSYRFEEVVWGARFRDMFHVPLDGRPIGVTVEKIHEIDPVPMD